MQNYRNGLYTDTVTFFHRLGEADGKAAYRMSVIREVKLSSRREYQKRDAVNSSKAVVYIPLSRLASLDDGFSISPGDLFSSGAADEMPSAASCFRVSSVEFFGSVFRRIRHIKVIGY